MEAWLFRIAHNLVVDRFRHNSRFQRSDEEDVDIQDDADPAGLAEQRVLIRDVRKAMECLTPDQREVVRLRFFAGLSSKETAAVMRKKDGAVREMQRAALEKLRGLLG